MKKYIFATILSCSLLYLSAQDKSLIKNVKEAGKQSKEAMADAEKMLENIEDALNAVSYEEAKFYVDQSVYIVENLQVKVGYIQDELLEISKISDDNGGIDIKLKAGEMEDKCLLVLIYTNSLYSYFNEALTTTDLSKLLLQFGAAKNTCENSISELKRVLEIQFTLMEMVNPEEK